MLRRGRYGGAIVLGLAVVGVVAAACRGGSGRDRFATSVAPILEQRCLGAPCHGVTPGAEQRGEIIDWSRFYVRVLADGRVADLDAAYATVKARVDTTEAPELSSLLRKPLARSAGGVAHAGRAIFQSQDEPAFRAMRDWIASESGGGEDGHEAELTPLEQQFARDVLPILQSRQCTNATCHGPESPFTAFQPPMIVGGRAVTSAAMIRANRLAARMHLFLAGDPRQSRLVRKVLPLERGGIAHRGGNDIFLGLSQAEDPAVAAIVRWADAERAAVLAEPPAVRGYVYVKGPVAAGAPFDFDTFAPGSDLWVAESGKAPRNLTAAAHPGGPADVRDPAVSHDGRRVVFAMRASAAAAHDLWEIGVDGAGLRQLTHDPRALPGGGAVANVQPAYGPDGRVYFVSTRAGHLAEGLGALDTEVWAVASDGALERVTHDPAPEAAPSFIGTGKSYGTLAFTVLRKIGAEYKGVVFRAPLDHSKRWHGDPELHVHHGLTADESIPYAMRTMPDGRFTAVMLGASNVWRAGRLAVFDRQLGPMIARGAEGEASVDGYRRALSVLDVAATASGASAGAYRHPVPLPDGRVLVSYAPGAIDLDDPNAAPKFRLEILTLREDRATGGPVIVARETLAEDASDAIFDAEPIAPRPLEDDPSHERAWDPGKTTGTLAYRHVETLEGIFSNLEPRGPRPLRDDLAMARVIESLPVTPDELARGPIGIGEHGRAQILGEVPLLGGSLSLEVPASRPIKIQTLGADRMTRGTQHARWVDVAPGQTFPGGVSPELYPTLCAGCHGALSGRPADAVTPVPDVITEASATLATYTNLDPRRPRKPDPVGAAPFTIDFRRDVAPLVARSCLSCHRAGAAAGGLALDPTPTQRFDAMYEALLAPGEGSGGGRKYVDERDASAPQSHLVERIYGRELDAPRALTRACPGDPPLAEGEKLTFVRWIELGAVYRGLP